MSYQSVRCVRAPRTRAAPGGGRRKAKHESRGDVPALAVELALDPRTREMNDAIAAGRPAVYRGDVFFFLAGDGVQRGAGISFPDTSRLGDVRKQTRAVAC